MSALLSISLLAGMITAPQAEEVMIQWKPEVGKKTAMRIEMQMTTDFGDMDIVLRPVSEVTKITEKEVIMKTWLQEFKLMMGGQDMSDMAGQMTGPENFSTQTFSKTGQLLKQEGGQTDQENPRATQMQQFYYPTQPVKMGESWTKDFKADSSKGLYEAKAKYTLEASEIVGKVDTWRVKYVYSEMTENMPMSSMGTAWIDKKNGEVVRMVGNYENAQFSNEMPPVNATFKMTRE